jgi:hypothetical protein
MRFSKNLFLLLLMLGIATLPALAQTTVYSPVNGSAVSSPFTLNMNASSCSSKAVTAVGYSLDSSTQTATFPVNYMNGPVSAPSGWHTIHIKVWNGSGGVCVTDVSVNVTSSVSSGTSFNSVVPSYAVKVSNIQALGNWIGVHDGGTPGNSWATMSMQSSPSLTGGARLFQNQFWYYGGNRFSAQFDDNQTSQNFFYDAWIYIANDSNGFSNLEFDLNQTMPSGQTVLMGFQCDSWINRWDYAVNGGSPTQSWSTWMHSNATCNVHNWAPNKWHHVQISYSHNSDGWVTYKSVWLDGAQQDLYITAFSGFAVGWAPAIVTNFQIDGNSSGTTWANVYLDAVTVYRW